MLKLIRTDSYTLCVKNGLIMNKITPLGMERNISRLDNSVTNLMIIRNKIKTHFNIR